MNAAIKVGFLFDRDNNWIHRELGGLTWMPEFSSRYEFIEVFDIGDVAGVDVLFILGYTKILPEKFLALNGLNLVIHESALPLGRGFSPVQWQILDGTNEIPVSMIEAANPVDSGDIYGTTTIQLKGHELMPEIRLAQANATKELIISFLSKFPECLKISQAGNATHYRRRTREDDRLDPDQTIRAQFNQLRIVDNDLYPAYFEIDGVNYLLRITKA
jgi:methionyl-tRNA formyltransferase